MWSLSTTKLLLFAVLVTLPILGSNDALSALTIKDVEKLNAGVLTDQQKALVKELNDLLKDSSKSTLSEVYIAWHQLKDTFPESIQNVIDDWESKRDALLMPVLDKLEDAAEKTGNASQQKNFQDFRQASISLTTGEDIPNITMWEYELLRQNAVNDLGNISDVLMNIYSNLSLSNTVEPGETVSQWFTDLSSIGPAITTRYNETLDDLKSTVSKLKAQFKTIEDKLKNMTISVKTGIQQFWNNTKVTASNFKNQTKEWLHNEHPKVENAINSVKTAVSDVGKRISDSWTSFINFFKPKSDSSDEFNF